MPDVPLPLSLPVLIPETVKVSPSVSVSPSNKSSLPSVTVKVLPSVTELLSLSATGSSFAAVTLIVIVLGVALSASPSLTVKANVV